MKTLQIDEHKALALYPTATQEFKVMLEDSFGKDFFNRKITDRVKGFDDILAIAGLTMEEVVPYRNPKDDTQKALNAVSKLYLVAKVLNEGWVPDWSNSNQRKYYPWFEWNRSGFAFSLSSYDDSATDTTVGSRLCFKSDELAVFAGKKFAEIYNEHLTISK